MISTIDANLMRAKSEGGIFKNELYKTRGEIKPLKEVNIRLKVTNQNLTKTLSTLQSQHKRLETEQNKCATDYARSSGMIDR